jgi:alpha-L-fucosidase
VAVERLKGMGQWLATYGPIPPQTWGVTTRRGDTVFVHVLDATVTTLQLPSIGAPVSAATLLATGERVGVIDSPAGLTSTLPPSSPAEPDRVVVLSTVR